MTLGKFYLLAALPVLFSGCGSPAPPPLPSLSLESVSPAARLEIGNALAAAQAAPGDAARTGALAMLLHAHERWEPARACYRRALALQPSTFQWRYLLAALEAAAGNPSAAVAELAQAELLEPDYALVRPRRAEALLESGRLGEAEALYSSLSAANPLSPEPWYGLGRTQAARGDGAAAAISFRQAIALYPRYGVAHYALAQALNKQGAAGEARRHLAQYERFRFLGPNAGDPELDRVSRLNLPAPNLIRQGADAEAAGRLDESIRLHERALAADPAFAQAHANLIQLHARTGNPAKAEEAYRKAMAINPAFADAHYNFGVLAFGQHRTAEARAAFEETLRVNPYHAEAHASLGYLLESQGREAQARRHYQEAIANDPQYRIAHFHLGRLLTRQGDYRRAAAHLEKTLLPEDDYSPGCHYALGIAYGRAGDRAKAVETLEKARALAAARNQHALLAGIDRDLHALAPRRP